MQRQQRQRRRDESRVRVRQRRAALIVHGHVVVLARIDGVQRAEQRRWRLIRHLHALEQEPQLAVAMVTAGRA